MLPAPRNFLVAELQSQEERIYGAQEFIAAEGRAGHPVILCHSLRRR